MIHLYLLILLRLKHMTIFLLNFIVYCQLYSGDLTLLRVFIYVLVPLSLVILNIAMVQ